MKNAIAIIIIVALGYAACDKTKEKRDKKTEPGILESDRQANGGKLRFYLEGKAMHDKYFVAQFTPKGDLFEKDNLQLYNYNSGSDKYPQILINIDYLESDLQEWNGKSFPLDYLIFTADKNATPLKSLLELSKFANASRQPSPETDWPSSSRSRTSPASSW